MIYANKSEILRRLYYLKAFGYRYVSRSFDLSAQNNSFADLAGLAKQIKECNLCELCKSRNKSMVGLGKIGAKVMFINNAPSVSEDMSGVYLDGAAGDKFRLLLNKTLNLSQDEIYVTSVLKCKIPANNSANSDYYELCKPYLISEIDIISPKVIVALGADAFFNLTNQSGVNQNFESVRGNVLKFKNSRLIPTYSPAWVLKNPSKEQNLIDDLNKIKELI